VSRSPFELKEVFRQVADVPSGFFGAAQDALDISSPPFAVITCQAAARLTVAVAAPLQVTPAIPSGDRAAS